jgi:RNA polymerase sigma factor (sigma-70 family)
MKRAPSDPPATTDAPDAQLAERAAAGDGLAFEELYRRHAQAAWRLSYTVSGNAEDAADAVSEAFTRVLQALPAGRLHEMGSVRAYLLTAARNVAIDNARKAGRQRPSDSPTVIDAPSLASSAGERMVDAADRALVASAFRTLPERWRSVLWLTEVEQLPAREAAPLLGLSPNGVAQLAVRARAGLRERYLQAQVRQTGSVQPECRFTIEKLGAYVAGGLSPRDLAKVDQHLAGCEECRDRQAELEDLGGRLRHVMLPIPLGLLALTRRKLRLSRVRKAGEWFHRLEWAERPLAFASAALFAAGLVGAGTVGRGSPQRPTVAAPAPATGTQSEATPAESTAHIDLSGDMLHFQPASASQPTSEAVPTAVEAVSITAPFVPIEGGPIQLVTTTPTTAPVRQESPPAT